MICNYCISLLPWFLSSADAGIFSAREVFCNTEDHFGSNLPSCLHSYLDLNLAVGNLCVP